MMGLFRRKSWEPRFKVSYNKNENSFSCFWGTVLENKKIFLGSILDLEKLITETIDDVFIDLPTRNFAEFMIILARRKKDKNKIRILYEEYDSDGSGSGKKQIISNY